MAIAGVVLLRRATFRPRVKWTLAVIALAPKILFLGVRSANPPPGLSFTIEPTTIAEVATPSPSTMSFSFSWSPSGETGRLTKDGLEVGAKKFTRR